MESCNIPRAPDVTPPTNVSRPQTLAHSHLHSSPSGNERASGDEIRATYSPGKTAHSVYKSHPPVMEVKNWCCNCDLYAGKYGT